LRDKQNQREKKLKETKKQLLSAATTSELLNTNPQSKETVAFKIMPEEQVPLASKMPEKEIKVKRMVAPGTRDAPKFYASEPEELLRFISRMEDLWKEAGIEDGITKTTMIGKYADRESENHWKIFKNYEKNAWEEFKKELITTYPEAAESERGTPAKIRELCANTPTIRLGDMKALHRFRRAFWAEAKKLLEPPKAMSNRELVELFIRCLSESFASSLLQFLGQKEPGKGNEVKARRPEDKYLLDDVCDAAIQVSENSQCMFDLMRKEPSRRSSERDVLMFNQPSSDTKNLSEKVEELEGSQALERDRVVNMNKMIETRISDLETLIKTMVLQNQTHAKGDCKSGNCKMHEAMVNNNPMQRGGRSLENERCFWCGLFGHFQADCEDLKNQIRVGNVKMNHEGKLRLKDGSFIPKFPADASLKERVEKHYARRPSQFYYGEYEESDPSPPPTTSAFSHFLGPNTNADKRTIAQLRAELDLRKREEALELRQKMLEKQEKTSEQVSGSTRAANVLDLLEQLTDEELAAIRTAKSGFN
jgi:hypothetical protein